jgi:hypothetical protein
VVLHAALVLDAVGLATLGATGSLALSALGSRRVVVATLVPLDLLGASVLAFRSGGPGLRVKDSGEAVARIWRSS